MPMTVRWGAVVLGAAAGLGITAVAAVGLFLLDFRPSEVGETAAFVFVQFFGQLAAGFIAGRFGRPTEAFHGSQAALLLYLVTAVLTLSAGGEPGFVTLLFSAVVALVLGAAGGVLSAHLRED